MEKTDYNTWFAKRLHEILLEKGVSPTFLSAKSGISRPILQQILGGRYASPAQIQKIADALDITVERLKQTDVEDLSLERLHDRTISNWEEELAAAKYRVDIALGATERGLALQVLGSLYFADGDYRNTVATYYKSLEYLVANDDPQLVLLGYESLLHTFVSHGDLESVERFLIDAEKRFEHHAWLNREIGMRQAEFYKEQKRYREAALHYDRLFLCSDRDGLQKEASRFLAQLGVCQLRLGDYQTACQTFDRWYERYLHVDTDELGVFFPYLKSLLANGEVDKAKTLLMENNYRLLDQQDPKLLGPYRVLLSLLNKETIVDQRVLLGGCDDQTRLVASMILFVTGQDSELLCQQISRMKILESI